MNHVHIHIEDSKPFRSIWQIKDGVYVCGHAFLEEELKEESELLRLFKDMKSKEAFKNLLRNLNGFYAVIKENDDKVYVAVDRVRSIPIFYGSLNGEFYISNDAQWIPIVEKEYGELAEKEFLLAGYVTGPDTLYSDLKQLQAGELLVVENKSKRRQVFIERYYRYFHQEPIRASRTELLEMLDRVLLNIFKRLTRIANGRLIVVPLSGGYDSRLILLMLKRLDYDNVISFTYGRPGNKESTISRQVAENLEIKWLFVPYTNEAWHEWFHSEEREAYYRMADGMSTLPHTQDWPAVWKMKVSKDIPDDSIFVPGHSADFLAGSHIPYEFTETDHVWEDLLVKSIMKKNYWYWKLNEGEKDFRHLLRKRILEMIEVGKLNSQEQAASALEKWDWQERQAKFIINSVRTYEFWGYDWWLPFWDAKFMDFWSRVPFEFRIGLNLYKPYVEQLYMKIAGVDRDIAQKSDKQDLIWVARERIIKTRLYPFAKAIYGNMRRIRNVHKDYEQHPLAWFGIVPKKLFRELYSGEEGVNSFLAMERLGRISFDDHDIDREKARGENLSL